MIEIVEVWQRGGRVAALLKWAIEIEDHQAAGTAVCLRRLVGTWPLQGSW